MLTKLNLIAAESSKNLKQAMICEAASDAEFRMVLEYAYNPFKTYGIIPDRPSATGSAAAVNTDTWAFLDDLIARRLTGNTARDAVSAEFNRLGDNAELLWRIIRKDLRAGFSESTINKAVKGLIPEFPYMRCSLPTGVKLSEFSWESGVYSQEKADGMYANINWDGHCVDIFSRQGSQLPIEKFGALAGEVRRLHAGTQSHGEILVRRNGVVMPREVGNGILNSVLKGGDFSPGDEPIYMIWDQIPLDSVKPKGKYEVGYAERYAAVVAQVDGMSMIQIIPTRIVHSLDDAHAHYREMLLDGKEGTVIKDARAIWADKTSKQQVKMKLAVSVDLEIVGFLPGEGKNAVTFGSVLTRTSDGLLEVAVSGYSDAERLKIWAERDDVVGRVMAVMANAVMHPSKDGGKYSLFLPRCVEIRMDKVVADSLEEVLAQFDAAVGA